MGENALFSLVNAEVAQLVEQLIRNQQVTGSSPVFGSLSKREQFEGGGCFDWPLFGHLS